MKREFRILKHMRFIDKPDTPEPIQQAKEWLEAMSAEGWEMAGGLEVCCHSPNVVVTGSNRGCLVLTREVSNVVRG